MFRLQNVCKDPCKQPRLQHWYTLDYVLPRQRVKADICKTRVMRVADCWRDHHVVRPRIKLQNKTPYNELGPHEVLKLLRFRFSVLLSKTNFQLKLLVWG